MTGATVDDATTIGELKALVLRFARERDWEQFHSPKDLGLALASEVGELLDHFRYRPDAAIRVSLADPDALRAVAHEMADCLWVLMRLADVCGVDLASALREKVELAAIKYPIERSRGRADKYTAYQEPGDDG